MHCALRLTCPRCGKGKLLSGVLTVAETCTVCGLELRKNDCGDGPAFFGIVVVGAVATTLAGLTEYKWQPPFWLHALIWPPLIFGLSLLCLRHSRAALIALQYRHRLMEFKDD
jgi:uncharacterized protein (DUF983 family)